MSMSTAALPRGFIHSAAAALQSIRTRAAQTWPSTHTAQRPGPNCNNFPCLATFFFFCPRDDGQGAATHGNGRAREHAHYYYYCTIPPAQQPVGARLSCSNWSESEPSDRYSRAARRESKQLIRAASIHPTKAELCCRIGGCGFARVLSLISDHETDGVRRTQTTDARGSTARGARDITRVADAQSPKHADGQDGRPAPSGVAAVAVGRRRGWDEEKSGEGDMLSLSMPTLGYGHAFGLETRLLEAWAPRREQARGALLSNRNGACGTTAAANNTRRDVVVLAVLYYAQRYHYTLRYSHVTPAMAATATIAQKRRSREPHVLFHHQAMPWQRHARHTPPSLRTRHRARRWKLRIVPSLIPETTRPSQAVFSPSKSTRRRLQGSRGGAVHDAGTAGTAGT
ncbi:hypothetical protein COCCADRAFT_30947 [Bipolaris zeicola 26-R-13]|uniref:Uncharacterized protein n=1 Tax=Cochliobolus carbonum (strain 26-R-13) TaxID=930089 RepID=W6Y971_COCC2|nr:uncharacterized protein COCCADRAFT_30947 [Bipolaris zeicola 26-R-13]EUC27611.1 hypothetical protein COCCADRAFT_30947 [Bipolaris zeicola 26-R-13]